MENPKKRGRPPKDNARYKGTQITMRLTIEELEKVERLASIKGVTRTDAIIQAVTDALERLTD